MHGQRTHRDHAAGGCRAIDSSNLPREPFDLVVLQHAETTSIGENAQRAARTTPKQLPANLYVVQPPISTNTRAVDEYCQQTAIVSSTKPQITGVFHFGVTPP